MGKLNVLYICHDTQVLGGAALSLGNMIHSLRDDVHPIILFRESGAVHDYFFRKGYDCMVIPFRLNKDTTGNWLASFFKRCMYYRVNSKCIRKVVRELKGREIAIVHSNDSVVTIGIEISKSLGAKHIWHLREVKDYIKPLTGEKRRRELLSKSDSIISITKFIRSDWGLENIPNSVVIPDAVRSKEDTVLIEAKHKYFVFCAAEINPWKGPEMAINALWLSGLSKSGYALKLIGQISDAYKQELKTLAQQCGIEDAVEFTGTESDIKDTMSHASGFLMCTKFEGLGRVTIEAMFYGCPVLARNHSGGTMEIVKDGETGLIFDDAADLAKKMQLVITDDMLPIIQKAQQYALEHFCEESFGEQMLKLYKEILNRN